MQVTITPDSVQATIALLGFGGAVFLFAVRAIVASENAKQLKLINGTYIRSGGASITGHEIERRLEALEGPGDGR